VISALNIDRPGIGPLSTTSTGFVSADGHIVYLPGGRIIDSVKTRDPGNAPDTTVLRPGLLVGRVSASKKYANSILGLTQAAIAAAATSFTLTPVAAAELIRRVGGSGTLVLTGPPGAAGTVARQVITYTAVDTATGVVTAAVPAAVVAGSAVGDTDGSDLPLTFVGDGYGLVVPPVGDCEFPRVPIGCVVLDGRLIDWPADAASRAYFRNLLSSASGGKFVFYDSM